MKFSTLLVCTLRSLSLNAMQHDMQEPGLRKRHTTQILDNNENQNEIQETKNQDTTSYTSRWTKGFKYFSAGIASPIWLGVVIFAHKAMGATNSRSE